MPCHETPSEGRAEALKGLSSLSVLIECNKLNATETEPLEDCIFNNQSYQRGSSFNDGCSAVCRCAGAGQVICKPRFELFDNFTTS
jgi:hypothetical protein